MSLLTDLLDGDDRAWVAQAKCHGMDPEDFHPSKNTQEVNRMRDFCNGTDGQTGGRCIVRDECLAYAVRNFERGVWGGTSDRERKQIRKARRAAG